MSGDITHRIEALLRELEVLSHNAREVPLPLLIQTLTILGEARRVVKNCASHESAALERADEDDPQPEVDGEMMERMYRSLGSGGSGRPPPKR